MTPDELVRLVLQQRELGLSVVVLKMPTPKSWLRTWRRPKKVSTPFGRCRWSHHNEREVVVYIETAKLEKWLGKMGVKI